MKLVRTHNLKMPPELPRLGSGLSLDPPTHPDLRPGGGSEVANSLYWVDPWSWIGSDSAQLSIEDNTIAHGQANSHYDTYAGGGQVQYVTDIYSCGTRSDTAC